jgi:hypothetical protein
MESPTALLMCGPARSTGCMILLLGANGAFGVAGHLAGYEIWPKNRSLLRNPKDVNSVAVSSYRSSKGRWNVDAFDGMVKEPYWTLFYARPQRRLLATPNRVRIEANSRLIRQQRRV